MPLPILHTTSEPSTEDLLRFFQRTSQHWTEQIAEGEQLDVGVAYANPALERVWDANHLRDAALPPEISPADAVRQVEESYASRGARCTYWVMSASAPANQTSPLIEHLMSLGYRRFSTDVLHMHRLSFIPARESPGLMIIPARASFRHARQIAEEEEARWGGAGGQLVEAKLQRLDDPHWDALIALQGNRAVAAAGVLAVGDLGRIEDVFVSESVRRQGIGRTMMGRVLEICARSLFKHIFLEVKNDNPPAQALYASCGFRKIGENVAYFAPGTRT
jgi:ribosomal protein S18 acetylase RimI-like enzyme